MINKFFPRRIINIINLFKAEPWPWALYLILIWMINKIRGIIFSIILNAPRINIGKDCYIRGINYIKFGSNIFIFKGLWLEAINNYRGQVFVPRISIGNRVAFSNGVHISCINSIEIGDDVLFGSHVYISDHNHGSYSGISQSMPSESPADRQLSPGGPVVIEGNVWIGNNVVILGPAKIGFGAILAANSIVSGDIPGSTIMGGIPARPLKQFNCMHSVWRKV